MSLVAPRRSRNSTRRVVRSEPHLRRPAAVERFRSGHPLLSGVVGPFAGNVAGITVRLFLLPYETAAERGRPAPVRDNTEWSPMDLHVAPEELSRAISLADECARTLAPIDIEPGTADALGAPDLTSAAAAYATARTTSAHHRAQRADRLADGVARALDLLTDADQRSATAAHALTPPAPTAAAAGAITGTAAGTIAGRAAGRRSYRGLTAPR